MQIAIAMTMARPVLRWGYDLSCTAHLGPVENKRRLARRVRVVGDDVMRQVRRLYEDDGGVTPGVEVELFNDPEIRAVGLAARQYQLHQL